MVLPGMKATYTEDPNRPGERRLPGFSWLPNRVRHLLISMLGEFVGTALFLTFAFAATQVANTPPNKTVDSPASTSTLLYISLAFGFSLLVNVWIFFRISGGLFNPAVRAPFAFHISPVDFCTGLGSVGSGRCYRLGQSVSTHTRSSCGSYYRSSCGIGPASRSLGGSNHIERWSLDYARSFHRSALHRGTHLRHLHVGCRETPSNVSCPHRHRSCPFHR
jgi:hypothetical protein